MTILVGSTMYKKKDKFMYTDLAYVIRYPASQLLYMLHKKTYIILSFQERLQKAILYKGSFI